MHTRCQSGKLENPEPLKGWRDRHCYEARVVTFTSQYYCQTSLMEKEEKRIDLQIPGFAFGWSF